MTEFTLGMGNYTVFVYGSYALMLVVVVGNWVSAKRRERAALALAMRRLRPEEGV